MGRKYANAQELLVLSTYRMVEGVGIGSSTNQQLWIPTSNTPKQKDTEKVSDEVDQMEKADNATRDAYFAAKKQPRL